MSTFYQHLGANLPTPNINILGERFQQIRGALPDTHTARDAAAGLAVVDIAHRRRWESARCGPVLGRRRERVVAEGALHPHAVGCFAPRVADELE